MRNAFRHGLAATSMLVALICACDRDSQPSQNSPTTTQSATAEAADQSATSAPTQAPPAPLVVASRTDTDDGVLLAKLSNGLTVIIKPMRSSPVVCVRAYVRAGGLYEGKWLGCGISHLTEHLVAKGAVHDMGNGTTAAEAKRTSQRVSQIGGQSNAYTSLANTCYYISATAGKAQQCVGLIADWLARPNITLEDFRREHGVVQRELEMGKDNPDRQMAYAHMANFFRDHPAAVPVIGYAAPLAALAYEDVLAYHARMYVPQNMVFCVVGDVDAEAVLDRICVAMAGFAHRRTPEHLLPSVSPLARTRRVVLTNPAIQQTLERMSFRTIPLVHDDLYALDVLSHVLTQGQASRLVQSLKWDLRLVTAIHSGSWTPAWGNGPFTISFRADPDKADQAGQAIVAELEVLLDKGISAAELDRAKRQKIADYVYSQQTVGSVSATLATDYMTTGDVAFSKNYTQRIQAVTAEQVLAAARKYITLDRMAITRMAPAAQATTQPTTEGSGTTETSFVLPNGLRVVLHPTDSVDLVSMVLVCKGGVLLETEQTNGLGTLMTALSAKGAAGRTATQISTFFDRAGGRFVGSSGNNSFYWQATVLKDSADEAMEILADAVQRPDFPEKQLVALRPIALADIARLDEEWFSQLMKFFRAEFFTDSPYGMMSAGRREVVSKATVEQIADWHRKYVKAGSSVLAVFGNFDRGAVRERIETLFAAMPEGEVALDIPAPRRINPQGERHVLTTDNEVAAVVVAVPSTKRADLADRFPLVVLDTIISGYNLPAGWLHNELRGRRLVYVVHAYDFSGLAPGAFLAYAATQPDKAAEVVDILRRNLRAAAEYKPTQEEIDLAVNSILTAELLDGQSMSSLAMMAALDELYGFGYDFRSKLEEHYRGVTPDDVLRVARKYLSGGYVTVITTPDPAAVDTQPATTQ